MRDRRKSPGGPPDVHWSFLVVVKSPTRASRSSTHACRMRGHTIHTPSGPQDQAGWRHQRSASFQPRPREAPEAPAMCVQTPAARAHQRSSSAHTSLVVCCLLLRAPPLLGEEQPQVVTGQAFPPNSHQIAPTLLQTAAQPRILPPHTKPSPAALQASAAPITVGQLNHHPCAGWRGKR